MWSVFYFFLFFRNEKYNPITCAILIHRNRLNFTKALIILRFRSEEYFIVFRHNFFFFFSCISTIFIWFNHYFLSISAKMLWFLSVIGYRCFGLQHFPGNWVSSLLRSSWRKWNYFHRACRSFDTAFVHRGDNRNARTQTRDTVSVAYSPLFIPPLLDRREK